MKKYFITGLMTLLPVAVTFAVVAFLFNLLTGPFVDLFSNMLAHFHPEPESSILVKSTSTFRIVSQVLIFILLIGFTIVLGALTRWFFFHWMIVWGERIVHKIPFISSVYKACQDVVMTVFTAKSGAFKRVVLAPFPHSDTYVIGLVTQEAVPILQAATGSSLVAVFIPTTPNPTSGLLIMFKPEQLIQLDMKIEDALKYAISCGVIAPPMAVIPKDQS